MSENDHVSVAFGSGSDNEWGIPWPSPRARPREMAEKLVAYSSAMSSVIRDESEPGHSASLAVSV